MSSLTQYRNTDNIYQNFINNFIIFQQNIPIGKTWFNAILDTLGHETFFNTCEQIEEKLLQEIYIYGIDGINPSVDNLWTFTNYSRIEDTKVVILGSYPSPKYEQTGLAFSNENGIFFPYPTLDSFFDELIEDGNFYRPNHNNLSGWAVQGVLLLNSYLTVRIQRHRYSREPYNHFFIKWDIITDAIVNWIAQNNQNVVFILVGHHAWNKDRFIDGGRHLIFKFNFTRYNGENEIYGSNLFSITNQYLLDKNLTAIDFSFLPFEKILTSQEQLSYFCFKFYIFQQQISMGISWYEALKERLGFIELYKTCFEINDYLIVEYVNNRINSKYQKLWRFTNIFPIEETKLVIVGNEPSINPEHIQDGLAFSTGRIPSPSLSVIYNELARSIPGFQIPNHAFLQGWAEERILLLNCYITVRCGKDTFGSHNHIKWDILTDAWIKWISTHLNNVVFILLGRNALNKKCLIDEQRHKVYDFYHPSGDRFYWASNEKRILGSNVFSNTNSYLIRNGISPIDFNNLPYPNIDIN